MVSTIPFGSNQYGAAFDSSNGHIYVIMLFPESISIISPRKLVESYAVTFIESGLQSGTSLSVTGSNS
ncbi:hypothetical protein [Caldiplasma sukawensis]